MYSSLSPRLLPRSLTRRSEKTKRRAPAESGGRAEEKGRERNVIYRGTSFIRSSSRLGPYSRTMFRGMWQSEGGGQFLMSEVPLYRMDMSKYHSATINGCGKRSF